MEQKSGDLPGREWAIEMAKLVGKRVQMFRKTAGPGGKRMTADQLSTACAGAGYPIDRSVIAKLERGLRHTVTLPEVLVLSKALGVPPLALMVPVGHEATTQALPDCEMETWTAAKWVAGDADEVIKLYRDHDALVGELVGTVAWSLSDDEAGAGQSLTARQSQRRKAARALDRVRENMRLRGLVAPELDHSVIGILDGFGIGVTPSGE